KIKKSLIDRIELYGRCISAQGFLHPPGHIAVKNKIERKNGYLVFLHQTSDLKYTKTQFYAQLFGLVAARHGTTVVVGQDNYRVTVQTGIEHPLATHEKVVAIGQGIHISVFLSHNEQLPISQKYCLR